MTNYRHRTCWNVDLLRFSNTETNYRGQKDTNGIKRNKKKDKSEIYNIES